MTRQLIARWSWLRAAGAGLAVMAGLLIAHVDGAQPRFFSDDPLLREPETQDASGATPWEVNLFYDLGYNLFVTPRKTRFIFADRAEKEYIECTRAEIARRLRTGEAVYMDEEPEVPFFERIMGGVMGKLKGAPAPA